MIRHFIGANHLALACLKRCRRLFDRIFWTNGGVDEAEPPENLLREKLCEEMFRADEIYVVGVREIIQASVVANKVVVGIHPTLLPFGRGGSPIQHQILNNAPSGITVFRLDSGIDTGPILAQSVIPKCKTSEEYYKACMVVAPVLLEFAIYGNKTGRAQSAGYTRLRLTDDDQMAMTPEQLDAVYSWPYEGLRVVK